LKPLYDKVRDVETDLASNRSRLAELEARLADEAIYANPDRQDELTQLVREQATIKSAIESLEGEWLEASEKLEQSS
jgi:ATP-binding cassette subfamily F protein 3